MELGTLLGTYEIVAPLGVGGMGEVYRAMDTRLGREVALKFLPEDFAADPERHARFEREARVLASLNHPNIAALYGLEHVDGRHALVMELVEGEDLSDWIARGPIPIDEAIPIALQVADALEAAHEKGIVHRDLKPGNVKVRPDGVVKVLDFGLAKVWAEQAAPSDPAHSQTITGRQKRTGVVLGTAAYMSPEQVRGKPVDKRADIWAFGCVVYEMLTGARTFSGDTVTDVMARVAAREPDWGALPSSVTPRIQLALRRCLDKDPRRRFRDIGDVRFELEEGLRSSGPERVSLAQAPQIVARTLRRNALLWIAVGLGLAVAVGLAFNDMRAPSFHPRSVRSYILPPERTFFAFEGVTGGPVLSPDGTRLVFAAADTFGKRLLWVRALDSITAQPLEGTLGASYPFWSPDSRFVGFFVRGMLRRIDTIGGPPQTVCDAPNGRGGSWNQDGVIIFAPDMYSGLSWVPSAGGVPAALTRLDKSPGRTSHRWPVFLPDGRHFLYWAGDPTPASQGTRGIYVGSLDGGEQRFLVQSDSDALYSPPGYLLWLRDQSLIAQRFDPVRLELTGEAFPVAEEVNNPESYRLGRFSVSQDGTLVYLAGKNDRVKAVWLNASGEEVGLVGEPAIVEGIRLSSDGQRLAEWVEDPQTKNVDIWLVDLVREVSTRFTFDPADDLNAVWSPDGGQLAWSSDAKGHFDIYTKSTTGAGGVQLLFASDADKFVTDWSHDGRFLTFTKEDTKGNSGADIWILPMFGDHKPYAFLATPFNESNAMFSPDGRWLAYQSDDSGTNEIYITPFPGPGWKSQVSQGGGAEACWRADGRTLYYTTPDSKLMEVPVASKGLAVEVGTPREFTKARLPRYTEMWLNAVATADDRLLVLLPEKPGPVPLTLVTHWTQGLKP